jgi:hypothetical protein
VLATFGGLMGLVEAINSLGVAFVANPGASHETQQTGSQLILAALGIQLAVILIFVGLAATFQRRCSKANLHNRNISTPMTTLYVSMALILARCIYRLVEHTGYTAIRLSDPESLKTLTPLLRFEWFFYIFEATLILVNSVLWNVWHPGRYLPMDNHIHLATDGTTEVKSPPSPDDRSMAAKIGNVLTLGVLFRRKQPSRPWEELREYQSTAQQA